MKLSLFPHLLELSREIKVGICSALFFALCFGGWAVLKTPANDCKKAIEPESEIRRDSLPLTMGLKIMRWEQLQINKTFRKRLAKKVIALADAGTNPEPVPAPAEPVESVDDSAPQQLARVEAIPENQIVSRGGERPDTLIKGSASWYGGGDGMDGRPTASGEIFDDSQLTAAHRDLPFGTRLKVTSLDTGKSVVVRINDRGPFNYNLILDLSRAAAEEIGLISSGIGPVEIEILE